MSLASTSKVSNNSSQLSYKTTVTKNQSRNNNSKPFLPYSYPYVEYRSLGEALSAVAHAQSKQKMKLRHETEATSQMSLESGNRNRRAKNWESIVGLQTSKKNSATKVSAHSSNANKLGDLGSVEKPFITASSELRLSYEESSSSVATTIVVQEEPPETSSSFPRRYTPTPVPKPPILKPLKSVIVKNVPSNTHIVPTINSVQLLQEKIMLATSRAEKFLSRKSSKILSGKELAEAIAQRQKTFKGMALLRELLNEPFIPEGYELSGKHLELASCAVTNIQELLNTDLFKNIQRRPADYRTQKVTWASGPDFTKTIPDLTKTISPAFYGALGVPPSSASQSNSTASVVGVSRKMSKHGILPTTANVFPQLEMRHNRSTIKNETIQKKIKKIPVKKPEKPTYNTVMTNEERWKKDAEKGLIAIEIDEFDPASCFFYKDEKGIYNKHKNHLKKLQDEMRDIKKNWPYMK